MADAAPHSGGTDPSGQLWRKISTTRHKDIGIRYLITAAVVGLLASVITVYMRIELMAPGVQYLCSEGLRFAPTGDICTPNGHLWNALVAYHGVLMMFYVAIPALFAGFGTYLLPLHIGAPNTALPRLNTIGYWLYIAGTLLGLASLLLPGAPSQAAQSAWGATGAALPDHAGTTGMASVVTGLASLFVVGLSALLVAINVITTFLNMRAPGMSLHKVSLFAWSVFVTAWLIVLAFPVLAGTVTILVTNPGFAALFFERSSGDTAAMFQHILWFFGHPEVYIIILPGFGIISQIIATFSKRPVFGYLAMVYAMVSIGALGFVVWAYHLFNMGLSFEHQGYFIWASVVVAIPTAIILYCWLATIFTGRPTFKTPMLWACGFVFLLIAGGLSGVFLAHAPVQAAAHAQAGYNIVAHTHYVMGLGAIFAIFAGIYFWIGKMSGRHYPEWAGKLHFWMMFLGANMTFVPQFILGRQGMVRHAVDYPESFTFWNAASSAGALVSFASFLLFIGIIAYTLRGGTQITRNNYWTAAANTLEWSLPCPPPKDTFTTLPTQAEWDHGAGQERPVSTR
ncbi:cytochrome c oxidase subunit I [Rhodobacteraceae bacterium]|nr:cytochrome c oxidase subunit I [Paracoccaceae bacterium]